MTPPVIALLVAFAAASTTMLGWLVAVARPSWRPRTAGWMLLAAASAMVLVSVLELLPGAWQSGLGTWPLLLWAAGGAAIVVLLHLAAGALDLGGNGLQRSAVVIAVALALHNVPEGAAPYAAALLSLQGGLVVALGLGLHNIAEGLAVATPVLAGGGTRRRAFWLTLMATIGEAAGAVIAFWLTFTISDSVAGGLIALVAGVMITVSVLELLPAAVRLLRSEGRVFLRRDPVAVPMDSVEDVAES